MTLFDVIALALLAVSAGVGFFRGAVREMATVLALLVAAAAALWGLRFSGPVAREIMDPAWAANVAAVVVVFTVVYIVLRLLGGGLANKVQATDVLGFLDRLIGAGFGLLRSLVVLGAFSLALNAATPPERMPTWITGAALYPLTRAAGEVLKTFAPKGFDVADRLRPAISDAVRDGAGDPPSEEGYDERARDHIDELVEQSR
ncbi:CvpA family protein [Phenylobacterium sp.]|uniref:CvpA family protein n=1 Tax=Phenylobacterium sp. TaxID=1871053 RepID=UPI00183A44B7|nr:CvpA family protein [Phenylobacterium sp.]MBA4792846.1 CvpA family protein [Phenylobacterium sp.]MBC7168183.1 CvpA family protein [Phenylobacterium sp.]